MSDGFWVFIGGMKTQAETDHALATLEHGGIRDALVMPETPDAGRRVSLGLYSERARADRRAQAVRQTGLKAEVAERKLPGTLYWVDLAPQSGINTIPLQDLFAEGVSSADLGAALPGDDPVRIQIPGPGRGTPRTRRTARARGGDGRSGAHPGRRDAQTALRSSSW